MFHPSNSRENGKVICRYFVSLSSKLFREDARAKNLVRSQKGGEAKGVHHFGKSRADVKAASIPRACCENSGTQILRLLFLSQSPDQIFVRFSSRDL